MIVLNFGQAYFYKILQKKILIRAFIFFLL
jgi:hypothetical protein